MIAHSLVKGFVARGWNVGFVGLVKPDRWLGIEAVKKHIEATDAGRLTHYWYAARTRSLDDLAPIAAAIEEMDPDIIYCYGPEAAILARKAQPRGQIVVTFYDPPHTPALQKRLALLRYGDLRAKARAIRGIPALFTRWRENGRTMLPGLSAADTIIGHSYDHACYYASRLARRVEYFPNPLELVTRVTRNSASAPPAFLFAGNVTSTVSLTGFYFFCEQVMPHIADALSQGEMQIRIAGGGSLPTDLAARLCAHGGVEFLGFVDEAALREEYSRTAALLVPTPIPVGFRTRIVDAFRYGVPTIVHSANRAGFSQLAHGRNCLMASDGAQFAAMMKSAIRTPDHMNAIADTARKEFETSYSAEVFCDLIVQFASQN